MNYRLQYTLLIVCRVASELTDKLADLDTVYKLLQQMQENAYDKLPDA